MKDGYKRMWKYCGEIDGKANWLRTHLNWVTYNDTVYLEGMDSSVRVTSNLFIDKFNGPSFRYITSLIPKPDFV